MMRSGFKSSTCRVKKFNQLFSKIFSITLASIRLLYINKPEYSARYGCIFLETGILRIINKSSSKKIQDYWLSTFKPDHKVMITIIESH
jgi:hypothetical protein